MRDYMALPGLGDDYPPLGIPISRLVRTPGGINIIQFFLLHIWGFLGQNTDSKAIKSDDLPRRAPESLSM